MNKVNRTIAVSLAALFLSACGGGETAVSNVGTSADDPAQSANVSDSTVVVSAAATSNTAVDVASSTAELSLLVEAVVAADLVDTLSGKGPFTIFAPTNDAFVALLGELGLTKDQLLANKALLTDVLTYHVLGSTVAAADVPLGQPINPLGGSVFKIDQAAGGALTVTDGRGRNANIIATDIFADNAVIHLIDRVILPANQSIVETAQANPDFSILVEAVVAADLVDTLSSPGPFTVFAPTNAAFADLLGELNVTKEALLADPDLLTSVLTYHVVSGQVLKAQVPIGAPIGSVAGGSFSVDSNLAITDERGRQANIVATDVFTTNGVIHVIDRVILPAAMTMHPVPAPVTDSIVDIAVGNPDFSILVEAVVAADLVDALSGAGPFTVFAPTNAAFADLLSELHLTKEQLLANKHYLTDVLLYHVFVGTVLAADISTGIHATSLEGGSFAVTSHGQIQDNLHRLSNIIASDVLASNGVIQVIDKVLLPYQP